MVKKENLYNSEEKDYILDGLETEGLDLNQINELKKSRRLLRRIENIVFGIIIIGGITGGIVYGVYKCLPEPVQQSIYPRIEYITSTQDDSYPNS
jgi:hypothetical protein